MSQRQHAGPKAMMWADGGTIFAAVMLTTMGVFQAMEGLSAVMKDDVFVRTSNYMFDVDLTAWGWAHLVIGAAAIVIGISILTGHGWAMIAGIVIAILSALANFLFIPFYPLWAHHRDRVRRVRDLVAQHRAERAPALTSGVTRRPTTPAGQAERQREQQGDHDERHRAGGDERRGAVDHDVEREEDDADDEHRERRQRGRHQPVRGLDESFLDVRAAEPAVDRDRAEQQRRREAGDEDQRQVDVALGGAQIGERILERQGQQEPRGQLGTGLHHPELLEQVLELAVQAFVLGLVAVVVHPQPVPGGGRREPGFETPVASSSLARAAPQPGA